MTSRVPGPCSRRCVPLSFSWELPIRFRSHIGRVPCGGSYSNVETRLLPTFYAAQKTASGLGRAHTSSLNWKVLGWWSSRRQKENEERPSGSFFTGMGGGGGAAAAKGKGGRAHSPLPLEGGPPSPLERRGGGAWGRWWGGGGLQCSAPPPSAQCADSECVENIG